MTRINFSNFKTIEEVRASQRKLERRAARQEKALSRHLAQAWQPWQSLSSVLSTLLDFAGGLRGSIIWWAAKPLLGKIGKLFRKK